MAKTLDFNVIAPPTLPLIMRDDRRTEIIVTTPTEGLVEELQAMAPELTKILEPWPAAPPPAPRWAWSR